MLRSINYSLAIWTATLCAALGCARQEPAGSSASATTAVVPALGEPSLLDVNDRPFDLWEDAGANATVVIFTRTDCPVSNRYAPEVRRLYEQFHPQGVRFFLVYVDPRETSDSIRAHLAEYEYPCPGIRDLQHRLVNETEATVTPEAVVFNAQQEITYRGRIDNLYADFGKARDAATTHDLADAITATLAGEQVAEPETKAIGCYIEDVE